MQGLKTILITVQSGMKGSFQDRQHGSVMITRSWGFASHEYELLVESNESGPELWQADGRLEENGKGCLKQPS